MSTYGRRLATQFGAASRAEVIRGLVVTRGGQCRAVLLSVMAWYVMVIPAFGATESYDGTYSGERSPINGATPFCVGRENVTVVIAGSTLKFTNREWQGISMGFNPGSDGSFGGAVEDPGGHVVDVRGVATPSTMDASVLNYGNGCAYHWFLEKNR
jgi:hypothetical protein